MVKANLILSISFEPDIGGSNQALIRMERNCWTMVHDARPRGVKALPLQTLLECAATLIYNYLKLSHPRGY